MAPADGIAPRRSTSSLAARRYRCGGPMRSRSWSDRLGRLLPRRIAEDAYRPSLADLRIGRAESDSGELRFAIAVAWIFTECLRLALIARLTEPRSSVQPRREYLAMFFQDV